MTKYPIKFILQTSMKTNHFYRCDHPTGKRQWLFLRFSSELQHGAPLPIIGGLVKLIIDGITSWMNNKRR
jgi:hypothetical protein